MAKLPNRFDIRLPDDLVEGIEDWRVQQRPAPTPQEAIRRLVRKALEAEGMLRPPPKQDNR
jgi:hypothetical protein